MAVNERPVAGWMGWAALAIGLVASAGCAAGIVSDPDRFLRGYLVAHQFWLGIALGSLALVMVHHLTGGGWGLLVRRPLEASAATLPLLALLFLPLLFGMEHVYVWTHATTLTGDAVLEDKQPYLNVTAFTVRAGVYFLIWSGLAWWLNRWSAEQDESDDPRLAARMRTMSGPGLVVFGLAVTFAAVDWVMSLQPHWYSTIFGVVYGVAQLLAALAFSIVVVSLLDRAPLLEPLVSPRYARDLGNLLLALVMFWSYVAFSQFFLIWIGNLPEETAWYRPRIAGGWQWLAFALIALQFALPFVLLLFRRVKRRLASLAAISVLILAMYLVNLFWQIIPAFPPEGIAAHGLEAVTTLLALVGIGGLWLAVFLRRLNQAALVPRHDPALAEVGAHG